MNRETFLDWARSLAYAVPRAVVAAAVLVPVLEWLPGAVLRQAEAEEAAERRAAALLHEYREHMDEMRAAALILQAERAGR